jgi:D-alanine-D-alanine ligase-like ATP-grasp enzyme
MRKHEFPFARVLVFVPFADRDGRLHNPYYDYPGFREDVSGWFEPLSLPHQWVAVTSSGLPEAIEAAADAHAAGGAVIVNLCDGSPGEEYPGLEVVEALEAAALPYTGADPAFYRVTSSKLAMKARFRAAGLPTAPWQVIHEAERDLWSAGQTLGYPLILKLDGGWGALSAASIVHDHEAALNLFAALGHELRRKHGPVFAEPFLPGREFTTFVRYD